MIVGLTGGIASGKSTASEILANLGVRIVDADKIAREICDKKEVVEEIKNKISKDIFDKDNKLDRKKLKNIVFNNDEKLETLNKIFHLRIEEELKKIKSNHLKSDIIIYDVPLLFETGIDKLCDKTILIYANRDIQIKRVIERDEITEEMAIKIINSQMNSEEKKKKTDIIIENNTNRDELKIKIEKIYNEIKEQYLTKIS